LVLRYIAAQFKRDVRDIDTEMMMDRHQEVEEIHRLDI